MAEEKEFRHIIRVANTDLDGAKPILHALHKIKGVSFMFANFACVKTGVNKEIQAGKLSDSDIKKLDSFILNPEGPSWILNRRKDPESNEDKHILGGDMDFIIDNDKKRLKMIKCYRGIRHMHGLPVRGQRTKSNFRKNKGKVTGVKKKSKK